MNAIIKPVSPVAGYVGGKRLLAKTITNLISTIEHDCYAEPFVGMGGIFLRRKTMAKCEIINDYSRDVITLFRILQQHYSYFIDYLKFQLASRAEFDRLKSLDPDTLTDIQRAARFLYLQRLAFGGKVDKRSFGVDKTSGARFDVTRLVPMLDDLHQRLSRVVIECLGYGDFIQRYDGAKTLFYMDPPYWGSEGYYGKNAFSRDDFAKLADILSQMHGKFILSLNDTAGVRETFGSFNIVPVSTIYSLNGAKPKETEEVLISNTSIS